MSNNPVAHVVRIKVETGRAGLIYASSPDLAGLLAVSPSMAALDEAISNAIVGLYQVVGRSVVAVQAERTDPDYHPWVIVPSEQIGRLLDNTSA